MVTPPQDQWKDTEPQLPDRPELTDFPDHAREKSVDSIRPPKPNVISDRVSYHRFSIGVAWVGGTAMGFALGLLACVMYHVFRPT